MKSKLIYWLTYAGMWLLALLPFRALYILSDGLYFLMRHVVHYRRGVVRKNLKNSFPEKSQAELREIEREFYHYICDYMLEEIKMMRMSFEDLSRRMEYGNTEEYLAMLDWSVEQNSYPVAIKVPGGEMISDGKAVTKDFSKLNTYEVIQKGSKVAVIGLGVFYSLGEKAAELIAEKTGVQPTLVNPYYITGLDEALLDDLKKDHEIVVTLEDGILDGGFGEKIARYYGVSDMKVLNFGLKKELLDRYDVQEVLEKNHLNAEQIAGDVEAILK